MSVAPIAMIPAFRACRNGSLVAFARKGLDFYFIFIYIYVCVYVCVIPSSSFKYNAETFHDCIEDLNYIFLRVSLGT